MLEGKTSMVEVLNPKAKIEEERAQRSLFGRLRAYFLAGIVVTAPIGITVYLTYIFVRFVDRRVTPLIPTEYNPNTYLPFSLPGIGLIVIIAFFIMVGWFAKNFLGRMIIRLSEYVVHRMPVIRNIYGAIKQIVETVMTSQSQAFRDAVMLEYPRKGIWSIGFVTGKSKGEVQRLTSKETVNVFIPTTPNPTSGFLLFVPKEDLFFLSMTVEEAVKLVISGGIVSPPDRGTSPEEEDPELESRKTKKKEPAKTSPTTAKAGTAKPKTVRKPRTVKGQTDA